MLQVSLEGWPPAATANESTRIGASLFFLRRGHAPDDVRVEAGRRV